MPDPSPRPNLGVALMGSYVPRMCGIATFTHDLATVFAETQGETLATGDLVRVIALNEHGADYRYGPQVRFEIRTGHISDYEEAAGFVNVSPANAVSLQHEFGIYGGDTGRHLLAFLNAVRKPVVTTLHTVFEDHAYKGYVETLKDVCDLSTFVVVMAERARRMLVDALGVPLEKVKVIPHGVPDVPFLDPGFYKDQFQLEGRRVMLTFGLMSPGKGIETAIEALSAVVEKHPDAAYIVLGATHPEVRRRNGEAYRASLEQTVKARKLTENVFFYNRYVTLEQLLEFLLASDVYLTPYPNKEQITSGTLAYAAGCGKAIVSTPYWHAEDLLADGRGMLVPFEDPGAMAEAVIRLLDDEVLRNQVRKRAYQHTRASVWKEVARAYLGVFQEAIEQRGRLRRRPRAEASVMPRPSAPEVQLEHVRRLTDDTGIIRYASFATPDRGGGYSTSDNALALIAMVDHWRMFDDDAVTPLVHTYLSFLNHALGGEGDKCGGLLSYDRRWVEEATEAACGRALWALGHTVAHARADAVLELAARLFDRSLPKADSFKDPLAIATAIIGIHRYLVPFSGASELRRLRERLAEKIHACFTANRSDEWYWHAGSVGREAGHLPHALLLSGRWLERGEMVGCGLEALEWLFKVQTSPETGWLSLIGDQGGYMKGAPPSRVNQRPVEAAALAGACEEAYLITKEKVWAARLESCLNWFLSQNDRREPLYDFKTKGVSDGMEKTCVSLNRGGEAVLSWLVTLMAAHRVQQAVKASAAEETETTPGT